MLKIRVFYDDQRELGEVLKLLSPRLNYCKTYPDEEPKRCLIGLEMSDFDDDLVNENPDEASKPKDFGEDTPMYDTKGGQNNEYNRRL